MTIDQLRALEKLLPDSSTVEMVKGYGGDVKLLGTAEDFFLKLVKVKQLSLSCLLWQCGFCNVTTWTVTGLVLLPPFLCVVMCVRSLCAFWKPVSLVDNVSLFVAATM